MISKEEEIFLLNLKANIRQLYSRHKNSDFSGIRHIPQKINWDFKPW